jgi:hypothetical protein
LVTDSKKAYSILSSSGEFLKYDNLYNYINIIHK